MKSSFVFVTLLLIIQAVSSSLQGPDSSLLNDKSKQNDRKSAKGVEDDQESQEQSDNQKPLSDDFEQDIKNYLSKDFNLPSSGIKIVKAPDLSKEGDNKKITETLANLLESQEKWIQKFEEELEEMDKQETVEEVVVEKTPEEIEGKFT